MCCIRPMHVSENDSEGSPDACIRWWRLVRITNDIRNSIRFLVLFSLQLVQNEWNGNPFLCVFIENSDLELFLAKGGQEYEQVIYYWAWMHSRKFGNFFFFFCLALWTKRRKMMMVCVFQAFEFEQPSQ